MNFALYYKTLRQTPRSESVPKKNNLISPSLKGDKSQVPKVDNQQLIIVVNKTTKIISVIDRIIGSELNALHLLFNIDTGFQMKVPSEIPILRKVNGMTNKGDNLIVEIEDLRKIPLEMWDYNPENWEIVDPEANPRDIIINRKIKYSNSIYFFHPDSTNYEKEVRNIFSQKE